MFADSPMTPLRNLAWIVGLIIMGLAVWRGSRPDRGAQNWVTPVFCVGLAVIIFVEYAWRHVIPD